MERDVKPFSVLVGRVVEIEKESDRFIFYANDPGYSKHYRDVYILEGDATNWIEGVNDVQDESVISVDIYKPRSNWEWRYTLRTRKGYCTIAVLSTAEPLFYFKGSYPVR